MAGKINWNVLWGLIGIFVISTAFGIWRNHRNRPLDMYPNDCITRKVRLNHNADVVFIGDSRTANNIDPETIGRFLPGLTVRNFGFSGQAMSDKYLGRVPELFKPKSRCKMVVLGLSNTNLSIVEVERTASMFEKYDYSQFDSPFYHMIGRTFSAFGQGELKRLIKRSQQPVNFAYHANGWEEIVLTPRKTRTDEKPESLDRIPDKSERINAAFALLLSYIKAYRAQNITVVVYRPPLSDYTLEVARLEGVDWKKIRSGLEQSGAIVLDGFVKRNYITLNDHLDGVDARIFCAELGEKLVSCQR